MRRLAFALLLCALTALPVAGCSARESATDKAFGAKVRAYLLDHPEVLQEALARLQAKEDASAAVAAKAALAKNRPLVEHDPRDPVGGAVAGRIVLTEFFDYRCPYCKASSPAIPALLKRHPDVRFVYKELPILSAESEQAARLALAAAKQGRYEGVHMALMQAPKLDDETTSAILTRAGVDVAKAKADAQSPEISAQINDLRNLAHEIGINATPTFVIGDSIQSGWRPEVLEAALTAAGSKPVG